MWGRLGAMVLKEFRQLAADRAIVLILIWGFLGAVYIAGRAVSMDINNYPVAVLDLSRSNESRELIARLRAPYFKVVTQLRSDADLTDTLDRGAASVALVIPPTFARDVQAGEGRFQVISDGTQSQMATLAGGYITQLAGDYSVALLERRRGPTDRLLANLPQVDARPRVEFNPNITSAWFTSLLELFNMITMISMLLTAAALVREKEHGTLEQLLVSPLRPAELFAAKIIPTVVVVLVLSPVSLFGIVGGVFGTPLRGSVLLFYAVSVLYITSVASLGIYIALLARNLAQAMMVLFLILFPMLFLSGATTPPESMSPWMRYATLISPMRYYIDFGYQVLFKGNGLAYVWHDILGMLVLGGLMFGFSVLRFRRVLG
ncbi:MAG TPA: ABC transporter permease [Gammaproteobacteria bacterium]|uniref:ABC transporter permease n=1 Tax=Immundisolibacter sp. TaxID=1934948 RepID=UPI000E86DE56|nr:ABC transporter permease [Gammaproteobacteria bacterium]HCZ48026.1 ABC transporter permease [Gammaproteobacteria bacterium]MCH77464.1 ABC transporter permease [Gammaproteobacteria bacterium]